MQTRQEPGGAAKRAGRAAGYLIAGIIVLTLVARRGVSINQFIST